MWRLWMSQSYFSLGFLSQKSLWKLSQNRGYKGIYIVGWEGIWKVSFFQIGCSGDLTSWLGWVASSSREQTAWSTWDFCLAMNSWRNSSAFGMLGTCATIWRLASCESPSRSSHKSLFLCTILSNSLHSLTHYPYIIPT